MQPTKVILVGGFLGAGKTTLIAGATEHLRTHGKRVGLITNDQAANLVDTALLKEHGLPIQEVGGGCFCCRFDDLITAMDRLVERETPNVLIGEPVGSCTDLSATVLQPLKKLHSLQYQPTPFSVVVDGRQLRQSWRHADSSRFPENVMYIYRKQLEEADLIVLNKADLLSSEELAEVERFIRQEFADTPVVTISALDETGIDAWLDHVMTNSIAGRTIADVDYDEYADGEAALGWLNAAVRLEAFANPDWTAFCRQFVKMMQRVLREVSAEIAHLKLHLSAGGSSLAANVTDNEGEPSIRGSMDDSSQEAILLINVRASTDPTQLRTLTEKCVQEFAGGTIRAEIEEIQSFAPARPTPLHRFAAVV